MGKAVVQCSSDDSPAAGCRIPKALPPCLFLLGIVAGNDDHKSSRHNPLHKPQPEPLSIQTPPTRHARRTHRHRTPDNHHCSHGPAQMQPLKQIGQRQHTSQHSEVEYTRSPTQPFRSNDRRRGSGIEHNGEGQVGGHAEDGGTAENRFIVVDKAIADPHEGNEKQIDLANDAALNGLVPRLSILGHEGGSDVSGVYMGQDGRSREIWLWWEVGR